MVKDVIDDISTLAFIGNQALSIHPELKLDDDLSIQMIDLFDSWSPQNIVNLIDMAYRAGLAVGCNKETFINAAKKKAAPPETALSKLQDKLSVFGYEIEECKPDTYNVFKNDEQILKCVSMSDVLFFIIDLEESAIDEEPH